MMTKYTELRKEDMSAIYDHFVIQLFLVPIPGFINYVCIALLKQCVYRVNS